MALTDPTLEDTQLDSALDTPERPTHQAAYVAFLHRVPYTVDAHRLGFVTGVREDYSRRQHMYESVDVPVTMLDNDFETPDIDRYVERFENFSPVPKIGVLGDAYDAEEAEKYVGVARALQNRYPGFEPILTPKCKAAFEVIPDDIILGYRSNFQ